MEGLFVGDWRESRVSRLRVSLFRFLFLTNYTQEANKDNDIRAYKQEKGFSAKNE